jgi:hypothetical protein
VVAGGSERKEDGVEGGEGEKLERRRKGKREEEERKRRWCAGWFQFIAKVTVGAPIWWCAGGKFFLKKLHQNLKPEKKSILLLVSRF